MANRFIRSGKNNEVRTLKRIAEEEKTNLCEDIASLTQDTGFQTLYSFEKGIKETIHYYQQLLEKKE